jgi:hypothetical protein
MKVISHFTLCRQDVLTLCRQDVLTLCRQDVLTLTISEFLIDITFFWFPSPVEFLTIKLASAASPQSTKYSW